MRSPINMSIARRLSTLAILIAAISAATGARAADDISNINPPTDGTKAKVQIAGMWYLKVGATFNNGYSGRRASIMDQLVYREGDFKTIDGETAAWIPLGMNETFDSCKVTVTAMKSTPNGPVYTTLASLRVKVTN